MKLVLLVITPSLIAFLGSPYSSVLEAPMSIFLLVLGALLLGLAPRLISD